MLPKNAVNGYAKRNPLAVLTSTQEMAEECLRSFFEKKIRNTVFRKPYRPLSQLPPRETIPTRVRK